MAGEKSLVSGEELLTPKMRAEKEIGELIEPAAKALRRILEINPTLLENSAQSSAMRVQSELSLSVLQEARGITTDKRNGQRILSSVGSDAVNREMLRRLAAKQRSDRQRFVEAVPAEAEEVVVQRAPEGWTSPIADDDTHARSDDASSADSDTANDS